jgi:CheY-like chemotaxis protein
VTGALLLDRCSTDEAPLVFLDDRSPGRRPLHDLPPDPFGIEAPTAEVAAAPRVLIVDDDATVRDAVQELLEGMGFAVVGAVEDGFRAVEMAGIVEPDVVLMDVRMPGMDGLEATRRIRTVHPDVQVVLLSAYDDLTFRQVAAQAGAFRYLVKGCAPTELDRELRAAAAEG